MKKWILALGTCAALSALPVGAFAHGYDAGDAALGGLVGGVVGGLISSGVVAAPVYAAPGPVVVERYAPPPVVVERPAPSSWGAANRRWSITMATAVAGGVTAGVNMSGASTNGGSTAGTVITGMTTTTDTTRAVAPPVTAGRCSRPRRRLAPRPAPLLPCSCIIPFPSHEASKQLQNPSTQTQRPRHLAGVVSPLACASLTL